MTKYKQINYNLQYIFKYFTVIVGSLEIYLETIYFYFDDETIIIHHHIISDFTANSYKNYNIQLFLSSTCF